MAKLDLGMISSTWLGTGIGVEEGIKRAKEIGFDTYDIFEDALDLTDAERMQIRDWCAAAELPIRSQLCVAFGLVDFNPAVQRFTLDRIKANIDQGAFFGARNVLLVVGEYYWDGEVFPRPAIWDMAVDLVRTSGEYAAAKGLEIALELEPFNEALLKDVHELVRGQREALLLADVFCREARDRIEHLFDTLHNPTDEAVTLVAAQVLAGRHKWLEDGIVGLHAADELDQAIRDHRESGDRELVLGVG